MDTITAAFRARLNSRMNYPKRFWNREGINMLEYRGELWEYPLKSLQSGDATLYGFGTTDKGPDRVIIDNCGWLCAVVTHTGAKYPLDSVECSYHA